MGKKKGDGERQRGQERDRRKERDQLQESERRGIREGVREAGKQGGRESYFLWVFERQKRGEHGLSTSGRSFS